MSDDNDTIGKRIRHYRERDNLTQPELADKIGGVSPFQVSRWENDKERPNKTNIASLAEVFGIHVRLLTEGDETNIETTTPTVTNNESAGVELTVRAQRDEYALRVYRWYREHENRQKIAALARAYYTEVPGVLNLPMVTTSDWLPEQPVPLSEFDEQLKENWVANAPEPPAPLLAFLGGEKFSDFIARLAPDVKQEDRFCYRLLDVNSKGGRLKLSFGSSSYRRFVSSCEALSYELGEWCFRHLQNFPGEPPRTDGLDLPKRAAPESIFDLGNRSGCPASSTVLIITNHRKGDFFYLQKRTSPELLDSPGGLHVVPSGQFQNDTYEDANHDRGFSLQRTVMRELAEELLGVKEVEGAIQNLHDFYDDPRVAPFVTGIEEGAVRGYFLGLGIDPLPTKPGLLSALVIDASRILPTALEFIDNWEGKSFPEPLKDLQARSQDLRLIPDGATCLRLAHRHLGFLLGKEKRS